MFEMPKSRRRFLQFSMTGALTALARPALAMTSVSSIIAAARAGLQRAGARIPRRDVVAVADFRLPSSIPRLHLVEVATGRITSFLVAHGRGSDPTHSGWLSRFSNQPGSDCTSNGAFVTGDHYVGQHGPSMRVVGLDPTNDNAVGRGIVVHSAPYVGPTILREHGVLGRSEGCFALSQTDLPQVLHGLGSGRLFLSTQL
jgi:hypothetical protein